MEKTVLDALYEVVLERKINPTEGSYTCQLFSKGRQEILKKVGEEAIEIVLAASANDKKQTVYELADLFYHITVMLVECDIKPEDIYKELRNRFGVSGLRLKKHQRGVDMDCIFCKILKREIPSTIVFEDEYCLAFEDINPQAPVHILVIPKKHIPTTLDIKEEDKELIGHLVVVAAKIAREKGIAEGGYRLVVNTNSDAGQTVFHVHLHLLGGRVMSWPPG